MSMASLFIFSLLKTTIILNQFLKPSEIIEKTIDYLM